MFIGEKSTQQSSQAESPFLQNWEALADLRRENERLAAGWGISVTAATAVGYLTNPLVAIGGITTGYYFQWRAEKVIRLIQTVKPILETFESQGVEVYPRVPVEHRNPLDLFIRFPKKTHLFVSIRSKGNREVVYNEKREILQLKKKGKSGLATWEPNPLVELADYEKWLSQNRGFFGMTSKEATKTPAAKVLILWHPTTAETHRDHLYTEMGDLRLLVLRRKGSAFVIQKEELINFIQAWLARYE